jgi:hypothetical protein
MIILTQSDKDVHGGEVSDESAKFQQNKSLLQARWKCDVAPTLAHGGR